MVFYREKNLIIEEMEYENTPSQVKIKKEPLLDPQNIQNEAPTDIDIKPEEAELIANSLCIDTNNIPDVNNTLRSNIEPEEDDSTSDSSSVSEDPFSRRMHLKSRFASGFAQETNGLDPVLTDFSCPIKDPVDKTKDSEKV